MVYTVCIVFGMTPTRHIRLVQGVVVVKSKYTAVKKVRLLLFIMTDMGIGSTRYRQNAKDYGIC